MRKTVLGVIVALGLFATGVYAAGDRIFAFKAAPFDDIEVTSPCDKLGSTTKAVAGPNLYDTNAWLTYTCENGRVFLRRYLNPNDSGQKPIPVFTVANPATIDAPTAKVVACTVPGMVTSINGGCVPPNHPLAPR